jgi:hypothetical protein
MDKKTIQRVLIMYSSHYYSFYKEEKWLEIAGLYKNEL